MFTNEFIMKFSFTTSRVALFYWKYFIQNNNIFTIDNLQLNTAKKIFSQTGNYCANFSTKTYQGYILH